MPGNKCGQETKRPPDDSPAGLWFGKSRILNAEVTGFLLVMEFTALCVLFRTTGGREGQIPALLLIIGIPVIA